MKYGKFVPLRNEFRHLYESGIDTYVIAARFGASVETVRRGIHAVGGKTFRRPRKYFSDGKKERQIRSSYGVVISELESLKKTQKSMCLWCRAPLPKNVLDCTIDHIGGQLTKGDKTKVRGLCCANGHCNRFAGMVEAGGFSTNSLLRPFIFRVRKVVALYAVTGPLS